MAKILLKYGIKGEALMTSQNYGQEDKQGNKRQGTEEENW